MNRFIEGNNTTEDRNRIGLIRLIPCFLNRFSNTDTARIHMLQADNCRLPFKVLQNFNRCISVLYIIIGKLLAMELLCICQRILWIHSLIESSTLMRVFSVAKLLYLVKGDGKLLRIFLACSFCQIACNHRVIACGMTEYLRCKVFSCCKRSFPVFTQLLYYSIII